MKTLYTAKATATGGRNGHVKGNNNVMYLQVRIPKQWGPSMMISLIPNSCLQLAGARQYERIK
jgi:organic hydroperoxide reductase OsmC/OhrA